MQKLLVSVLLFTCLLQSSGQLLFGQSKYEEIVSRFHTVDAKRMSQSNIGIWKTRNNDNGGFAWTLSYVLSSYTMMYELTHEASYINNFVDLADMLVEKSDDRLGLTDYKGRRRVGWSCTAFGEDHPRVVFLVQSALIVYPLATFAWLVRNNPDLSSYRERATRYQRLADAALKEFDSDWRYDSASGEGHYVFEEGHPLGVPSMKETPVPFNMELAAGRVFIELWKVTGDSNYRQKAEALAKHFKNHLSIGNDADYVWNYSVVSYSKSAGVRPPTPEDVSHATLDVSLAVLAAQNSIVFTREDLGRFVRSFFRYEKEVQKPTERDALNRWLPLSSESCQVYDALYPQVMKEDGVDALYDLAESALYAKKCSAH